MCRGQPGHRALVFQAAPVRWEHWAHQLWVRLLGHCNQDPQTGRLKTTGIYGQFWRPESKVKVSQGQFLLGAAGNPGLVDSSPNLCLHVHRVPLCVSVSHLFPSLP